VSALEMKEDNEEIQHNTLFSGPFIIPQICDFLLIIKCKMDGSLWKSFESLCFVVCGNDLKLHPNQIENGIWITFLINGTTTTNYDLQSPNCGSIYAL